MRLIATVGVLLLAACGSDPPSSSGGRPPVARLIAENVRLVPGEERAVRIGFEPFTSVAQLRVEFRPSSAIVSLCALPALDAPIERSRCRVGVGSGVREELRLRGLKATAIMLDAGDVTADLSLEFDEAGRRIALRLPELPRPPAVAACADNACNPFFELVPTRSGAFDARARWDGGPASLVLLQGRVLGRSFTATGIPYAQAARADGGSPLRIGTRLAAPGEYALAFSQSPAAATGALTSIAIDVTWP